MKVKQEIIAYRNGEPIHLFTVQNDGGLVFSCTNYGCTITEISVPDKQGNVENIVLGFDRLEEYEKHSSKYIGGVVGRFAGRINNGKFRLHNKEYQLTQNNNGHHLHGGKNGFSASVWRSNVIERKDEVSLQFFHESIDGGDGYPGNVSICVTYTITNQNELLIEYKGTTDQTTILNMTNHTYFNLSGNLKRDIRNHFLMIDSDAIAELNEELIPTGALLNVEETEFDFRKGRAVLTGNQKPHPQNLLAGGGYDHPFILNKQKPEEIILIDSDSGRKLTITTDESCVILYTGNTLGGDYSFRGVPSQNYLGMCLETQALPDSINQPNFKSPILEKGEVYSTKTKYSFAVVSCSE